MLLLLGYGVQKQGYSGCPCSLIASHSLLLARVVADKTGGGGRPEECVDQKRPSMRHAYYEFGIYSGSASFNLLCLVLSC